MSDAKEVVMSLRRIFDEQYRSSPPLFIQPNVNCLKKLSQDNNFKTSSFLKEFYTILTNENSRKSYVVLGNPGYGKTTLGFHFCKWVWEQNQIQNSIPIYIFLPAFDRVHELTSFSHLIQSFAEKHELDFETLKNLELIVIVDGYDQVSLNGKWGIETEVPNAKFVHLISPDRYEPRKRREILRVQAGQECKEIFLEGFSDSDIKHYFDQLFNSLFVCSSSGELNNVSINETFSKILRIRPEFNVQDWIANEMPSLMNLARNPGMLKALVQVLPKIVLQSLEIAEAEGYSLNETPETKTYNPEKCSLKGELYENLLENWFQSYIDKFIETRVESVAPENLKFYCHAYARNWVSMNLTKLIDGSGITHMICSDADWHNNDNEFLNLLEPNQDPGFLRSNWKKDREIFKRDYNLFLVIKFSFPICLSKERLEYVFDDSCIWEYFANKELFKGLLAKYEWYLRKKLSKIPQELSRSILSLNLITKDHFEVLSSLADTAKRNLSFVDILFACVEFSKKWPFFRKVAANSITILNLARISLSGKDFRFVQIPGAILIYSLCANTDFRGADLTNVSFLFSWATGTKFSGANFKNSNLGIQRTFSFEDKFPLHVRFWTKEFIFIQFGSRERQDPDFRVYKFSMDSGQIETPGNYYCRIKIPLIQIRARKERGSGITAMFQIFADFLALWNGEKIKVLNLSTNAKLGSFRDFEFQSSLDSRPENSTVVYDLNHPSTDESPAKVTSAKPISFKFNKSGSLLAISYFVTLQLEPETDSKERRAKISEESQILIFKIKSFKPFEVGDCIARILCSCNRENFSCPLSLDFCGPTSACFLNHCSLSIFNLENNQDIKRLNGSFDLEGPFVVDPNSNNSLVAVYTKRGSGRSSKKLVVIDLKNSAVKHNLHLDLSPSLSEFDFHPSGSTSDSILMYEGNIMAAVSLSFRYSTIICILRIWDTITYGLVYSEMFQQMIQVQIVRHSESSKMYKVAILAFGQAQVKVIQISTNNARTAADIELLQLFGRKISAIEIQPKTFDFRVSPDLKHLAGIFRYDGFISFTQKRFNKEITVRKLEFRDLETGRMNREVAIESRHDWFIEWIITGANNMSLLVLEDVNQEGRLYNVFGECLTKWKGTFCDMAELSPRLEPEFRNFVMFVECLDENKNELTRCTLLVDKIELGPATVSERCRFRREYFLHDLTDSSRPIPKFSDQNGRPETYFQSLTTDTSKIIVWKLHACHGQIPDSYPGQKFSLQQFEISSSFEPRHQLIARTQKGNKQILEILQSPKMGIKAEVKFWFDLEYIHFLSSTEKTFRILLVRYGTKTIFCLEFFWGLPDLEKNFSWKLAWGEVSMVDYKMDQSSVKNVINLSASSDRIIKSLGAEGIVSIPREPYIAKGDVFFPILGTAHLKNVTKFPCAINIGGPFKFNAINWILSAIALKTPVSGYRPREHLCLTLEGEIRCDRFTIRADLFVDESVGSLPFIQIKVFESMEDIDEFINRENVSDEWVYFQTIITSLQANDLIVSILLDRRTDYSAYQKNCIQWVIDKLKLIGIEFRQSFWDKYFTRANIVKKPVHGGSQCSLF